MVDPSERAARRRMRLERDLEPGRVTVPERVLMGGILRDGRGEEKRAVRVDGEKAERPASGEGGGRRVKEDERRGNARRRERSIAGI